MHQEIQQSHLYNRKLNANELKPPYFDVVTTHKIEQNKHNTKIEKYLNHHIQLNMDWETVKQIVGDEYQLFATLPEIEQSKQQETHIQRQNNINRHKHLIDSEYSWNKFVDSWKEIHSENNDIINKESEFQNKVNNKGIEKPQFAVTYTVKNKGMSVFIYICNTLIYVITAFFFSLYFFFYIFFF